MEMTSIELAICAVAVVAGGVVQGAIGFGLSLIAVPVIGIIDPGALPGTMLILAIPFTAAMAFRERENIDVPGFWLIAVGRIPGTLAALWLLSAITERELSIVIGAAVILAVGTSVIAPEVPLGTTTRLVAGTISGLMGTAASIGGPPLAIAYQRRPGPELRSTLAISFVFGSSLSLAALWVTGHVDLDHLVLAAWLFPGLALGLFLATKLQRFLDKAWLRPTVLVFAAISGAIAILRSL
jgi:uncharacterized membrane protein YfcA